MNTDPYSTPAANPNAGSLVVGGVSAGAVQHLAATKPWVRFISVITFIGAGFMLIGAAAMAVMGAIGSVVPVAGAGASPVNPFAGPMGFGMAALYVVLAIVYVFPGMKLWKYANAIALLVQSGREEDLVAALDQQRSFWKFVGIMMVTIMIAYVLIIIGAMIFAVIMAAKGH